MVLQEVDAVHTEFIKHPCLVTTLLPQSGSPQVLQCPLVYPCCRLLTNLVYFYLRLSSTILPLHLLTSLQIKVRLGGHQGISLGHVMCGNQSSWDGPRRAGKESGKWGA